MLGPVPRCPEDAVQLTARTLTAASAAAWPVVVTAPVLGRNPIAYPCARCRRVTPVADLRFHLGPAGRLAAPQQLRDHAVGVVRGHDQLRRFPGRRVHPDLVQLDHRNVLAPASAVICTASCGASPAAARPAPWHPSLVFQSVLGTALCFR